MLLKFLWAALLSTAACAPSLAFIFPPPRSGGRVSLACPQSEPAATCDSSTPASVPCPGYPECSGEYRDKGCDGTGSIAGGVGALLEWWPIKAYRPCPSFLAAKYTYSRQGQSLNEVVFGGSSEKDEGPTIIDRMAGNVEDEPEDELEDEPQDEGEDSSRAPADPCPVLDLPCP
ncbi:unnamed protein product [Discosporangium mesarthrocarpum]